MSIVRILVDGYSLLHKWPQLAPGKKRHTEAARDALIEAHSTREFEVLFSRKRKTADDIIERATHRLIEYGEVLVVTDDYAERDTVAHLGALTSSCAGFIENVDSALGSMTEDIANFNRRERKRFQRQGAK